MKSKRSVILIGALCIALALGIAPLLTTDAKAAPRAKILKIGALYSLTGPCASTNIHMNEGAILCAEWINDNGGIIVKGQQYFLEIISVDDRGFAQSSVTGAERLVHLEKVKFMVGQSVPPNMTAVTPVTERAKVLRVLSWGTEPGTEAMSKNTKYTFRGGMGALDAFKQVYDYLKEKYPEVTNIAYLCPDENISHLYAEKLGPAYAKEKGWTVVETKFYPFGGTDYYPYWTKVIAANPEVVFTGPAPELWTALLLKQGRERGFKGIMVTQSQNPLSVIKDITGPKGSTDCYTTAIDPGSHGLNLNEFQKKILDRYVGRFGEKVRSQFVNVGVGWNCVWPLAQAIEKAQSLDTTMVAETWEKMETVETMWGTAKMGGLKTYGVNHVVCAPIPLSYMKDGEIYFIKWMIPEIP